MPPWQRWATLLVVGSCLTTGLVYWIALDVAEVDPSGTRIWWIAHGLTSLLALMAIGGALTQHVKVTWRLHRGRVSGAANLIALLALALTSFIMFYGLSTWRDVAITVHWIVGLASTVLFPLHLLWGRTRLARHSVRTERFTASDDLVD